MKSIRIFFPLFLLGYSITGVLSQTLTVNGPLGPVSSDRNVLMRCFVTGLPSSVNTRLQWFKLGNPEEIRETSGTSRVYIERDGQQSLKLYITDIQKEDSGTYRCEGRIEGNTVSDTITLELYQDITFDNAPTPQHPVIYTHALIVCEVSGQPAPEISWRYRGQKIENNERYTIDQGGLRVRNITENDNGLYECRAEVAANGRFEKRDISVIVHTPPKIIRQVGTVQGIEGQEVSLSCQASGNPPPRYEFYKDNQEYPVQNVEDRVYVDHEAGVVDFRPLFRDDQGLYRCEAANDAGIANSNGDLDVIIPPKIYEYRNVTQGEGEDISLLCKSEGEPSPVMEFCKVGAPPCYTTGSNENGRIEVRQVQSGQLQLTVSELKPTDTANYTCNSRNSGGFAEQNGTITVEFAPLFPDQVTEFYGWAGKTRNVTCMTHAEPVPEIEWWQYNEKLTNNETFRIIPLVKNSVLQIFVREEDSMWIYSEYTCRARNNRGQNDFRVQFRRAMTPDAPQDVNVVEESPTTLVMEVVPPLDDGGMPVIGYRVSHGQTISDFGIHDQILIENLRPSTIYEFLVSARNEVGPSDPSAFTHKMPAIQEPYPIVIVSPNEGLYPFEYTLHWEKPKTGGLPIKEYQFKFRRVKVQDDNFNIEEPLEDWMIRFKEDNENAPMQSYKLEGLTSDQHYQAEVLARNDLGWSAPNSEFVFLTAQDPSGRKTINGGTDSGDGTGRPPKVTDAGVSMSTAGVIGVVIAVFFIFLVIVDISCYFLNNCGITKCICVNVCGESEGNNSAKKLVDGGDPEKGGEGREGDEASPLNGTQDSQHPHPAPRAKPRGGAAV